MIRYRLFGGLDVHDGAGALELGGPKQRAVLAALLLDVGRPVSPASLVERVWPEEAPDRADASLQAYVSNLRRVLEPTRRPREAARVLVTQPAGYALLVARDAVDAARFEDLAAAGQALLAQGDPAAAAEVLDQALEAWTGALLPELAGAAWVDEAARRLEALRALALEQRFDAGLALGEGAGLVPRIESAVAADPYRERWRAQLAIALYRAGRQREALRAIQDARQVLADDVGIDPGPELRAVEAAILAHDPALDARPLAEPAVASMEIDHAPAEEPGTRAVEPIDPEPEDARRLVGRDTELAVLLDAFAAAERRHGRPVVISGEPGIGKTRLVEELVARVPGAMVAWGRCPESGAQAAYLPCIQIARQLDGAVAFDADLAEVLLPTVDVQQVDPSAERLALHVSVTRLLAAAQRPVVLVIDDLQWADPASLRLIEYVAGELAHTTVLLVATVRPLTVDSPAEVVDCLAELARQPGAVRLELAGLQQDHVETWLDLRSTGRPDPAVAAHVLDRTGGNPFFIGEVVELLASDGRLDDVDGARAASVPRVVQDVVRRRVSRLPAETQQLLASASINGRTFDVDVLADVAGTPSLDVLEHLDSAVASGLVTTGDRPGRFQFSHALVAETLATELNMARKARLHAATADALARLRSAALDDHAAQVAHHALEGAAAGSARTAHEWSVRAAHDAAGRNAHEDAARHWARAVQALELADPTDTEGRYEAQVEQGLAHLRADEVPAAYDALTAALRLALDIGDHERIGRAAASMTVDGLWMAGEIAMSAIEAAPVLERAVTALGDQETPARALAMANLADNSYWTWPVERLDDVSAAALELARRTGDELVLARTLQKRMQATWRPSRRAACAEAAAELAEVAGDRTDVLGPTALMASAFVAWERGDLTIAEDVVGRASLSAQRLGNPALITQLGFFRAGLLTWRGRLAEAEQVLEETYELYRRTRRWAAEPIRAGFLATIRAEQDRLDEMLEDAAILLEPPYGPWFRELVIWALAEGGRLDEAADLVDGEPPVLDSWLQTGVLAAAAHSRATLGEHGHLAVIREHLRPQAGLLAATGTGSAFGDTDFALARCELALGDPAAALRHVDASVTLCTHAGEGPWLARSLLFRAELTGEDADRQRAADIAARLRLPLVARRL